MSWQLQFAVTTDRRAHDEALGIMQPGTDPLLRALATGHRHLARSATETLESLGTTPNAVARSLVGAGARGEIGDPAHAPLAAFATSVIGSDPGVDSVSVEATGLTITRRGRWHREVVVAFPPPVAAFVAGFEAGRYPELERKR